MLAFAPGDCLAFFTTFLDAVKNAKAQAKRRELVAMRIALKNLYFSDATIDRLNRIPSIEEFDALNYEAGQASIRQRDTRGNVLVAFSALKKFGTKEHLSIEGSRMIQAILSSKLEVRSEIEAAYFSIVKTGNAVQTAELVEKIKTLNSLIEQLDTQLGGLILSGR